MVEQTIAHYHIQAKIGAGGMGEVYRARDTRLERDVALKVLPEAVARDSQRMARFEREARVLASMNHPNIASIYGVEESNGARALVMELVEGSTLAERISQGALPLDEALPIAKQICEGLEYAHERGVIHRDLKPANIKITSDGAVKILDFGLAKALGGDAAVADISSSPTISHLATQAGVILGTAAYMSPEQAKGKAVDRRADIWAFGCVLYEVLTAKRAFDGETVTDVLAAIVRAEPEWSLLPAGTPLAILNLLRRCLKKDAKQRLQAIGEARIAIDTATTGAPDSVTAIVERAAEPPVWRRTLPWGIAAIAILAALALLYWRSRPEPHQVMHLSLSLPQPLAGILDPNPGSPIALSPDGSQIVFVGSVAGKASQLFLLPLEQRTAVPLAGTENAVQPFFSPDGQWVGFFALGRLYKVSLQGGPAIQLADAQVPHGASWADNDTILYAPDFGSGLVRVAAAGETPQVLTAPNGKEQEVSHRWPQVLPGGKAILFTIQLTTQTTYDESRIAVLSLQTGKWRAILEGGSCARYVPSGHIVYAHGGSLMAAPFDLQHLQVTGKPVPVLEDLVTTAATSGGAEYDIAPTGLLAYVSGTARVPERSLVWVDRQGVGKKLPAPLNNYSEPRISPDGKLLAVQIASSGPSNIWIYDFDRNMLTRLTFGAGSNAVPIWAADGHRVIYRSVMGSPSFRWKPADDSGSEEVLLSLDLNAPGSVPFSVSPNGKILLYGRRSPAGVIGTYTLSLDGRGSVQPYLQATYRISEAEFSPDGRWVAYVSNESARDEVYVQPFPGPGGKWMISVDGGSYPRWARNGREIFLLNGAKMMSVAVDTRPTFKAGTPRLLFENPSYVGFGNYDPAPDGQHFLMTMQEDAAATPNELNVILNWTEELKRRAPAEKR
jgi:serine/threonine protein kinase/Tol biopolymer transport system component